MHCHGQEWPLPDLRPPAQGPQRSRCVWGLSGLTPEGPPRVPAAHCVSGPSGAWALAPSGQARLCRPGSDSARQEGRRGGACAGRRGAGPVSLYELSFQVGYPGVVFPRSCSDPVRKQRWNHKCQKEPHQPLGGHLWVRRGPDRHPQLSSRGSQLAGQLRGPSLCGEPPSCSALRNWIWSFLSGVT